jgi:hypothetical protein
VRDNKHDVGCVVHSADGFLEAAVVKMNNGMTSCSIYLGVDSELLGFLGQFKVGLNKTIHIKMD